MNETPFQEPIERMSVLLYHAVVWHRPQGLAPRERKFWMDSGNFRRHLSLLAESPHPVVPLRDAWRARTRSPLGTSLLQAPAAFHPAVLTFDDGWESDLAIVWPRVLAAGFPATFFVNTSTLGRPGHLCWNEVRRMSEEGASFQSHSHRHIDLTRLPWPELVTELKISKDLLEGWVKRPVDFLSVPYGRVNRKVTDAAREAGYRAVCTSDPRPARPGTETISRVAIHASTKPSELADLIAGRRISYWSRSARAMLLSPVKPFLRLPSPKRKLQPEVAP